LQAKQNQKIKGHEYDTIQNLIGITHVLQLCGINLPRKEGAK